LIHHSTVQSRNSSTHHAGQLQFIHQNFSNSLLLLGDLAEMTNAERHSRVLRSALISVWKISGLHLFIVGEILLVNRSGGR
jgi:hypothetical protein